MKRRSFIAWVISLFSGAAVAAPADRKVYHGHDARISFSGPLPPRCDLAYVDSGMLHNGYWPQIWCDGQRLKYCVCAMPKLGIAQLAKDEGIGRLIRHNVGPEGMTWLIGGKIHVEWVRNVESVRNGA